MTQEEKSLLLKDLCARLAYRNTKCYNRNTEEDFTLSDVSDTDTDCPIFDYGYCDIEYIQPYLRPMESMTNEERLELSRLTDDKFKFYLYTNKPEIICYEKYNYLEGLKVLDWLNSHHFDYRGLIEKSLALPAKENIYND